MKLMQTILILLLAAGVDGNWTGMASSQKGDQPVNFSFKANGNELTGKLLNTDGTSTPIEEGHIEGNNLSFSVSLNFPGKSFKRVYKGVLDGDQIHFSATAYEQVSEFVVKRVK